MERETGANGKVNVMDGDLISGQMLSDCRLLIY